MPEIRAKLAAQHLSKRLNMLMHPDGTPYRFVMFDHDSPGLREMRHKIGEAIVYEIESNPAVLADFLASNV